MLSRPTLEEIFLRIKADMESRLTGDVKIPRYALLGLQSIVFAGASHLQYGFLEWIAKQVFPDLASEWGLTRWGRILNLPRKAEQYTTGVVEFSGTPGQAVVITTGVQNSGALEYTTDEATEIGLGGTVQASVTAVNAGSDYNTLETTLVLSSPTGGIDTDVSVISGFDDGVDLESLEDWRARILQRFQNPPSSGTTGDYERWALEVTGVARSWAFAAEDWGGAGTVGLGVSDGALNAVSATILQNVETYVDGVKPEPAAVDYFNVIPKPTEYAISISPDSTAIREAIIEELKALHLAEASPGGTLLISSIRRSVGSVPVDDYEITDIVYDSVSIGANNVVAAGKDIPQYASVTFSAL